MEQKWRAYRPAGDTARASAYLALRDVSRHVSTRLDTAYVGALPAVRAPYIFRSHRFIVCTMLCLAKNSMATPRLYQMPPIAQSNILYLYILYLYHPHLAAVRPGLFVVDHRNGQYIAVVIAQHLDGDIFAFLDLFDGRFDGIVELLI